MGFGVVPGSCLTSLGPFLLVMECSVRVIGKMKVKKASLCSAHTWCPILLLNADLSFRFISPAVCACFVLPDVMQ